MPQSLVRIARVCSIAECSSAEKTLVCRARSLRPAMAGWYQQGGDYHYHQHWHSEGGSPESNQSTSRGHGSFSKLNRLPKDLKAVAQRSMNLPIEDMRKLRKSTLDLGTVIADQIKMKENAKKSKAKDEEKWDHGVKMEDPDGDTLASSSAGVVKPKSKHARTESTVRISNLPEGATEEYVKDAFKCEGTVRGVRCDKDVAWITFQCAEEAEECIKKFDRGQFDKNKIFVTKELNPLVVHSFLAPRSV